MDAVEEIQERTERLVRERQQLRSMDAVHRRLEANRLELVRAHRELSQALIERHAGPPA